jgi:hypothetical protein
VGPHDELCSAARVQEITLERTPSFSPEHRKRFLYELDHGRNDSLHLCVNLHESQAYL